MWPNLQQRSADLELMDDLTIGGAELREALRQLQVINAALGAARPTLEGVARFWRTAGKPTAMTVLDVGAGSGDLSSALLGWADRHGVRMQLVLVDINPETCAAAADAHRGEPRVVVVCSDLLHLALRPVDVVTAALFTHHFSQSQLPTVYRAMIDAARHGVVVNDLHRHWLAWVGIWLATRLLSRNRMICHDAPLSVRRGFREADFHRLRAELGLDGIRWMWFPLFRYLILVPGGCHAS